jgi:hypothetical protein
MTTKVRINVILRIQTEQRKNEALHFDVRRSNFKPVRPLKVGFHEKVIRITGEGAVRAPEFSEIIVQQNATLKLKSANK